MSEVPLRSSVIVENHNVVKAVVSGKSTFCEMPSEEKHDWTFRYVWPDEYLVAPEKAFVLVAELLRAQDIPATLNLVNKLYPLPELRHLKRVRRLVNRDLVAGQSAEIILTWALPDHMEGQSVSAAEFCTGIEEQKLLPVITDNLHVRQICKSKLLTTEHTAASKLLWPTASPNPVICVETHGLDAKEQSLHAGWMDELFSRRELKRSNRCSSNRLLVVDPKSSTVLYQHLPAESKSANLSVNPLDHPVMLGITHISGAQRDLLGKRKLQESEDGDIPYLCTGKDIYLLTEPCVMCAMALVHSRIGRVFFARESPGEGALASVYKLHVVKKINHHFEVWKASSSLAED